MPTTRAVLFDLGGTLYDYATLQRAEAESLVELAQATGATASPAEILRAHRDALRTVFYGYLQRRYYLHRDLFRDAVVLMLERLGARADAAQLDRYRERQWAGHQRDFALREGVPETLHALRERGLHLGIVSNIDEDQLTLIVGLGKLTPYFDSILSSEATGSCKPDPAIFNAAIAHAGCRPEEALFIGDTIQQDIAGANRVGLRSVLLWHKPDRPPPNGEPRPHHVIRRIPDILGLVDR
jgi:putative hydrolase of the HAD superfamily